MRKESWSAVSGSIGSGGVVPGCARTGAGGTPALPGGAPPITPAPQGGARRVAGRSPADAAEPSRLVALRGSLFFQPLWITLNVFKNVPQYSRLGGAPPFLPARTS